MKLFVVIKKEENQKENLAVEDILLANRIYEKALELGKGIWINK